MSTSNYLTAMKADAIPSGWSGLWFVHKLHLDKNVITERHGKVAYLQAGTYTYLRCLTDSTLYDKQPGAVVMEDTPYELMTHLGFAMRAYGRVLVTGLGLGCVVRGLLQNSKVEHVTVIENSKDVLKLVAPHMPATDRLTIIEADALEWCFENREKFDCAWHDLWTNRDRGEPHLDKWHTKLFVYCKRYAKHQGAWAYNRDLKNSLLRRGFPWIG